MKAKPDSVTSVQKRRDNGARKRRTQAERRASTQKIILEATLRTLVERGYAGTSLSLITEEAKVSRGAINHHFPNKAELVASAMRYFYTGTDREDSKREEMATHLNFRERMRFRYEQSLETMPLRLEFLSAMRTDTTLRDAYVDKVRASTDEDSFFDPLFPEFSRGEECGTTFSLLSAVMLGLGLTSSLESEESSSKIFEHYIDLLENHVNSQGKDRA